MTFSKSSKSLHVSHNSIFCLFIRVHDVTYVEMQLNLSKLQLHKFVKIVKNTIKPYYRRCFLNKNNKKCNENQG